MDDEPNAAPQRNLRLNCPCGVQVTGLGEDALVAAAERHLAEFHPQLVGAYTRDMILFMAY